MSSKVKLKRFSVSKLNGQFDHSIEFPSKHRVTFLVGRNGVGKTSTLLLLQYASFRWWSILESFDFKVVELTFTCGGIFKISKSKNKAGFSILKGSFKAKGERRFNNFDLKGCVFSGTDSDIAIHALLKSKLVSHASCGHHYLIGSDSKHLDKEEVLEHYSEHSTLPQQLELKLGNWRVSLIRESRMHTGAATSSSRYRNIKETSAMHLVEEKIKETLSTAHGKVTDSFQKEQSEFLALLLEKGVAGLPKSKDIGKKVDSFRQLQSRLQAVGLSISVPLPGNVKPDKLTDIDKSIINASIDGFIRAEEPFISLLEKLELFREILNSTLLDKEILFGLNSGISVRARDGSEFDIQSLSSGEQQQVLLINMLLFEVPEESTVFIDEPEISMDVEWQSKIGGWLDRIGKEKKLDFLLATHSPLVIGGKGSATVALTVA